MHSSERIEPKPIPGLDYHILVYMCDEVGANGMDQGLTTPPMNCESGGIGTRTMDPVKRCNRVFFAQYQGGRADAWSFVLPDGTGVPVGRDTGFTEARVFFHFFRPEELVKRGTAGSAVRLTMTRTPVQGVASLLLSGYGFVGAHDIGSVRATWTLTPDVVIRLKLIYYHSHGRAIETWTRIMRSDGASDLILHQDPRVFQGMEDVSRSASAVMRAGDQIVHECTFNNTEDHSLRIE